MDYLCPAPPWKNWGVINVTFADDGPNKSNEAETRYALLIERFVSSNGNVGMTIGKTCMGQQLVLEHRAHL
jgi:hypothetical protein